VKEVETIKKLEGSMQVLEMNKKVVKVQQVKNLHFGNMNIAREGLNLLAFGTMEAIRMIREVQQLKKLKETSLKKQAWVCIGYKSLTSFDCISKAAIWFSCKQPIGNVLSKP
jgi:hypothetical protein